MRMLAESATATSTTATTATANPASGSGSKMGIHISFAGGSAASAPPTAPGTWQGAAAEGAAQVKEAAAPVASRWGAAFRSLTATLKQEAAAAAAAATAAQPAGASAAALSGAGVGGAGPPASVRSAPVIVSSSTEAVAVGAAAAGNGGGPAEGSKFGISLSGLQGSSWRVLGGQLLNALDHSMQRAGAEPSNATGADAAGSRDAVGGRQPSHPPALPSASDPNLAGGASQAQQQAEQADAALNCAGVGDAPEAGETEAQQRLHRLVNPGRCLYLVRTGAGTAADSYEYQLVVCDQATAAKVAARLLLKKSMLKDHYLKVSLGMR